MMARFKDNKQTFRNFVMVFEFGNNYNTQSHMNIYQAFSGVVVLGDLVVWPHPVERNEVTTERKLKNMLRLYVVLLIPSLGVILA
jgi:hypothetical protein